MFDLYDAIYMMIEIWIQLKRQIYGFREKLGHNLTWESSWGESCMFLRGCLVLNCLD